jgi:hypothetical protein
MTKHSFIAPFLYAFAMPIIAMDSNLGVCATEAFKRSQYETAEQLFEQHFKTANPQDPKELPNLINHAETLLALGRYHEGFQKFEARLANPAMKRKALEKPLIQGSDVKGKTILVRCEHGIGDTFLFMRFTKWLHESGAHVFIREQRRFLQSIISRQSYISGFAADDSEESRMQYDYDVYAMSLPLYVSNNGPEPVKSAGSLMPTEPYIEADPQLVTYWRQQLRADRKFKILIAAYRASKNIGGEFRYLERDISIAKLLEKLSAFPDISVYCASGDHRPISESEYRALKAAGTLGNLDELDIVPDNCRHLIKPFDDTFDKAHGAFEDTAAVMQVVDHVVSVDTSAGQLAGSLGTKFALLLPKESDWRWGAGQPFKSPFFPTAELFWQTVQGNWSEPVSKWCKSLESGPLAKWREDMKLVTRKRAQITE